jgi:hypothetical protein
VRTVEVKAWCDDDHGSPMPATAEVSVILPGNRTVVIDLCDRHLAGFAASAAALGTVQPTKKPGRRGNPDKANPQVCPHCGGTYANIPTLRAHVRRMHKSDPSGGDNHSQTE